MEGLKADAQALGGPSLVVAEGGERLEDEDALGLVERDAGGLVARGLRPSGGAGGGNRARGQRPLPARGKGGSGGGRRLGADHRALDASPALPHGAGPRM